jgi:hypothetical protein
LRTWIVGGAALLAAGAAHAEGNDAPYAEVDGWEITALGEKYCTMESWFTNDETGATEVLLVLYDAGREAVGLTWGSSSEEHVPPTEYVDLAPFFAKRSGSRDSWMNRSFHYQARGDINYFTHVFKDADDSRNLLSNLGKYTSIALFHGEDLMMAIPLPASVATDKLRECSSQFVQGAPLPPE